MANVLIVYGSTTGNTETAATMIGRVLSGGGHDVTVTDVSNVSASGLCQGRDCVLFGCSTWGDDAIELQDDFLSLYDDFDSIGAKGVKTAAFGCGDSSYTYYCGAVDAIEEKLKAQSANIIAAGLKIDGDPGTAKSEIEEWAKDILASL